VTWVSPALHCTQATPQNTPHTDTTMHLQAALTHTDESLHIFEPVVLQCLFEEDLAQPGFQKFSKFICFILPSSSLLEEKVLYRTLKGSISTTYLEPLKDSIHS